MSAESIEQMCADIVAKEGGYCDRPHDSGGPTMHGISLAFARSLPKVNGRSPMDLNGDGVVDVEDIKLVTVQIAERLFKQHFFDGCRTAELPACIQPITFDMNVNGGAAGGTRMVQLAILSLGELVAVDGDMGDRTIAAAVRLCSRLGEKRMVNACVDARIARYRRIVEKDPSQGEFLSGWINRASSFRVR